MIVVEYEFLKNSKGVTSQFYLYDKRIVIDRIYRSEFADNQSIPIVSMIAEGITFGWAIKPIFEKEDAKILGPLIYDSVRKDWDIVDKKEGMSWLVAISKKGGKKYED